MRLWRITSLQKERVVALPDLGVYLQPSQDFEVPEDRAVWSRDLQEALRLETVRKEIVQETRQIAPQAASAPLPRPKAQAPTLAPPQPDTAHLMPSLEETNQLLKEILVALKDRPVVTSSPSAPHPEMYVSSLVADVPRSDVFIPTLQKEQVEVGGTLTGDAKIADSNKAKNAREKLKQLKGGG